MKHIDVVLMNVYMYVYIWNSNLVNIYCTNATRIIAIS